MRWNDDIRKCVVFLGYADPADRERGIHVKGTGFFQIYEGVNYLVTARHVAHELQDIGWVVRMNKRDGTCKNIEADSVAWVFHPDDNVDLAVTPFFFTPQLIAAFDHLNLPHERLLTAEMMDNHYIGLGDSCFTIGLFHLLVGEKRNLPIVHGGSIALLPGDGKIPVRDWFDEKKTRMVEAFVIESQSMPGLSGSPVLVQPTITTDASLRRRDGTTSPGSQLTVENNSYLLGIFQAAWHAKPSEIVAVDRGKPIVVSVGMGIVIPAQRLVEVFELPALKKPREEWNQRLRHANAATPTAVPAATPAPPATKGDAQHKERFTALLDAAVRKPGQGD